MLAARAKTVEFCQEKHTLMPVLYARVHEGADDRGELVRVPFQMRHERRDAFQEKHNI